MGVTLDKLTGQALLHKHKVEDLATSNSPASNKVLYGDGSWQEPPGATGGEANVGENIGTAGVGVYKEKVGVALRFKKINAGSNKITITDDTTNNEVDIDIDETKINHSSLTNLNSTNYSHLTSSEKTDLLNNSHTHSNKSLLDTYTQTNEDLQDAVNKKHNRAHSLTSTSDHSPVTGTDKGKYLKTNPTTGNPELVSLSAVAESGSYNDLTDKPSIPSSHTQLTDIGTNTHTQIDAHLASTSNPHSVTKEQVGLGNVQNVDTTNASNITSGTLDGDRLPSMSSTKKGGVPPTGIPSGKYLKDDGTWDTPTASASWGSITGTLSNQTDLQSALDGKSDANHNHNLADLSEKSYNSLTDKPTIPTKTSQLENDSGFISSESDPVWNSEKSSYYTKTQTDTLLAGKSDTGHTHTKSNITDLETITTTPTASAIPKANTSGKIDNGWLNTGSGGGLDADTLDGQHASSFASSSHSHDDRYFTETELSTSGGGGAVHWDNVTNKPSTYTPSSHTHTLTDITDKGALASKNTISTNDIDNDAVTYAKIQNVSTSNRILGRISSGSGDIEELTGTQVTSLLDVFTSSSKGLVPASGGGTTNFLRADGTWAAPSGSGGGDNITINGSDVSDADFDDSTPSAPSGGVNVKWQKDTSSPANISAYLPIGGSFIDALRLKPFYYTDFLGPAGAATVEAAYPFDFAAISSGTQAKIAGEANHPGILRISSSTTANSGGYVLTDLTAFLIAGGECFELVFQHRVASGTNTTIRFGYLDTNTSADATDGVYFEIPANSLDLVGKTASNSTRSTTSSSYTLSVNTWYRARLVVNSNATRVDFYLFDSSGTQLWTDYLTTNIPTGSGRNTGAGVVATNSGTTATLLCYLDWMAIWFEGRALTG